MTLLGLHGFSGSGHDWAPLARALHRPIEGIDLVGHDTAEASSGETICDTAAMIQCVVRGMGDEESMVVVGYSMGGRVALRFALAHPGRVRALVLIGANPGMRDPVERAERMASDHALAAQIEEHGVEWFCSHWANQPMIRSQQAIDESIRNEMNSRKRRLRSKGLAAALRGFGQGAVEPVWDRLGELCMPSLLLTGEEDSKYTDIALTMLSNMPNATHRCIANAGHCAHLENIDASARAIDAFLTELSV